MVEGERERKTHTERLKEDRERDREGEGRDRERGEEEDGETVIEGEREGRDKERGWWGKRREEIKKNSIIRPPLGLKNIDLCSEVVSLSSSNI